MTTFSRTTFNAAKYASFRPIYPETLYRTVLDYHSKGQASKTGNGVLVDLGTGHGAVARRLAPFFPMVYGIDPSEAMIQQSRTGHDMQTSTILYECGSAEDLHMIDTQAASCLVAGQAAHWFDYDRAWREISRVLKPGGTLAFWGYKDNVFLGYPDATKVADKFVYERRPMGEGTLPGLAEYWEQPGRERLRNLLRDIEPPTQWFYDIQRINYEPNRRAGLGEMDSPAWLEQRASLGTYESYVRTFSAFAAWKDAHPLARSRADGGEGDVVDHMMDEMVLAVPSWQGMGERWRDIRVHIVWGTYILLARKKGPCE